MSQQAKPSGDADNIVANKDRRALFARHAVLGLLTEPELDQVLAFAVVERYPAGRVIFRRGESGRSLVLIVEGQVKVSVSASDTKEAVLAVLGRGEILGEMAILENKSRSADATALTPCEVLLVQRRDFIPFLEGNPAVAIRLLTMICDRLRRTSALLEDRVLLHLPERLAKTLLDLAAPGESQCRPGTRIDLPIRQKVFASLLGTSRETLNKQLHAWQSAGLITLSRDAVVIEQPEALARLID